MKDNQYMNDGIPNPSSTSDKAKVLSVIDSISGYDEEQKLELDDDDINTERPMIIKQTNEEVKRSLSYRDNIREKDY